MSYYFPHSFSKDVKSGIFERAKLSEGIYVDSGKSALKLIINNLNLSPNSKIAAPAFVCNSVIEAIKECGHVPYFLDLKDPISFWGNYSSIINSNPKIGAILILHLYGFIHPDTSMIIEYAQSAKIPIIHDAAQSYGIDYSLFGNYPLFYSYGAGKSSSAALGGEIKGISSLSLKISPSNWKRNLKALLFFYSRFYNHPFSAIANKLSIRLSGLLKDNGNASRMSSFQIRKAKEVKLSFSRTTNERAERYYKIRESIINNSNFLLCYDNNKGQYFKIVFKILNDHEVFKKYLISNKIPFYHLHKDIINLRPFDLLPICSKEAKKIFEISTERSIPFNEINRIAKLLKEYR